MARLSTLLAVFTALNVPPLTSSQLLPNISQILDSLISFGLVKDINVFITPQTLVDNTVSLNFDVQNPLPLLDLTLTQITTNAGLDGTTYFTFNHTFPSPGLVIPSLGTANSGTIDGVTLPLGALATLGIIPFGKLDLTSLSASTRQITINGIGGLPLPLSGLSEPSVPTLYSPTPGTVSNPLSLGLVNGINVIVTPESLTANSVSLNFNVQNLLPLEITIDQLTTDAGLNGTTFLSLNQTFPSPGLVVPGLSTVNSGSINNVALPQGSTATFGIIPSQKLDLTGLGGSISVALSGLGTGIPIPLSGVVQLGVPTTYTGSALAGFPLPLRRQLLPPTSGQITDILTDNGLISSVTIIFLLETIITQIASLSFTISNPLIIDFTLSSISGSLGQGGKVFATFSHTFTDGIVVPAGGSANSGTVTNVTLTQGALPVILGLIQSQKLDLTNESANLEVVLLNIIPVPIPLFGITQTNIPAMATVGLV